MSVDVKKEPWHEIVVTHGARNTETGWPKCPKCGHEQHVAVDGLVQCGNCGNRFEPKGEL